MDLSSSDVIAGLALVVSVGVAIHSHFSDRRQEKRGEELAEAAEERRLIDEIILEAHALSDDVRLHGGEVVKTRLRAKEMEIKSGSYNHSTTAIILNECEGKRIAAEDTLQLAQPVMSGGEASLKGRTQDDLRTLLRDMKKSRNKVGMLRDETRGLMRD